MTDDHEPAYVDELRPGDRIRYARTWLTIADVGPLGDPAVKITFTDGSHLVDHRDGAVYRKKKSS